MKVRFDPVMHQYFEVISDRVEIQLPSVTQIMKEEGICGGFYKGTAKRDRGTLIHKATEVYDAFEILPESDDECLPFVKAWKLFKETMQFEIIESEMMVWSDTLRYAGTLDRIILADGKLCVLDIKSGAKAKWHPLQLAAYGLAYEERTGNKIKDGIVSYLKETGRPSVEKYGEYDMRKHKEHWKNIMIRRNQT